MSIKKLSFDNNFGIISFFFATAGYIWTWKQNRIEKIVSYSWNEICQCHHPYELSRQLFQIILFQDNHVPTISNMLLDKMVGFLQFIADIIKYNL